MSKITIEIHREEYLTVERALRYYRRQLLRDAPDLERETLDDSLDRDDLIRKLAESTTDSYIASNILKRLTETKKTNT